jgi:sterol desaturase/sphingolipid hydroxylase (fatty acid hydroxylase superfamily)
MDIRRNKAFATAIRHGLYPLLLLATLGYAWLELAQPSPGARFPSFMPSLVVLLLVVERLHPLRGEWQMTRATFLRRDLPFLLVGGATIGAANFVAAWAILHFGLARGAAHAGLPFLPALVLALALPDFLWYWFHRWSHEARGPVGRWLWRAHVAHHLPQQVYVLMHVVAHPLNSLVVRLFLTAPLFLLGLRGDAIFVASLLVGLQGLVSHLNVDVRAGWFNYLFMGTELHRYHHSADVDEAKNFGATVVLWDLLFGTFVYRPDAPPRALGVGDPDAYPADRDIRRVLGLPFVAPDRWATGNAGAPATLMPPPAPRGRSPDRR